MTEADRLEEARAGVPWREWGPYLSERQWGTVREDYSASGNAWDDFSHDQARSRAYRRGEDGLAGISDSKQRLCFSLALWNGQDPILKERLFGLTNSEGNHGEDVKEYYYYLDSTPTHSYMRYLYKYPHSAFPYDDLVAKNRARSRLEPEYELMDTGVFNNDDYYDVFVEYAKVSPDDILILVRVCNRSTKAASLHVLPTLWFRNTWSFQAPGVRPHVAAHSSPKGAALLASHEELGQRWLYAEGEPELLFTENNTNNRRLFDAPNESEYVKDGFDQYVVTGATTAVNPAKVGTKAAAHYQITVPAHGEVQLRLRLSARELTDPWTTFAQDFEARRAEADQFYTALSPANVTTDQAAVMRQALSGMLWSKQYYFFDVQAYLEERGVNWLKSGSSVRNREWFHMINDDVISMPDKWEYPWYAAWDLAFHTVALSMVDIDFAKAQLDLMLGDMYLHPSGQLPAYEWNFGDVNPPVHAWAAFYVYQAERAQRGKGDLAFLERIFGRLMMNFTWWVNRKDRDGRNVFEGGFLGLDNISVFDRSSPLPHGGHLEQADGTAWMALFCQNMLELCVELSESSPVFEGFAMKYADHFFWIAAAMNGVGDAGMWDEEDGFYYDVLRLPDGSSRRLKVRSLVGLLPLCATTLVEPWQRERMPQLMAHAQKRLKHHPQLREKLHPLWPESRGQGDRGILALVTPERLRRILSRVLDENEFLGPYGIRSVSRYHLDHPYVLNVDGQERRVEYLPGESDSGMFGGNSNWRGPVWMPMNVMLIRSLLHFYMYYGDEFQVECPTGSGVMMNLFDVAKEIGNRLAATFLRDSETGKRPVFGGSEKFQTDPHFRDYLLFYEYFHGDNGAGIGASHQTGWTGLVAKVIDLFARMDARSASDLGRQAAHAPGPNAESSALADDTPRGRSPTTTSAPKKA